MPFRARTIVAGSALLASMAALAAFLPRPATRVDFADAQRIRLRAHFDSVEGELLARDVSSLTPSQRTARARQLVVLRRYRDAGVFPRNHDVAGRSPIFVDRYGTHCAMGHLIATSGRTDIVARVHATRNTATIHELAADTALLAWLDDNGLTVDEAARIQPAYEYEPPPLTERVPERTALNAGETWAAAGSAAAGVAGIVLSTRPTYSADRAWLGVGAGVLAFAVGATQFDESGTRQTVGLANAVIGTASIATAAYAMLHNRAATPVNQNAARSSLRLSPIVVAGQLAPALSFRRSF